MWQWLFAASFGSTFWALYPSTNEQSAPQSAHRAPSRICSSSKIASQCMHNGWWLTMACRSYRNQGHVCKVCWTSWPTHMLRHICSLSVEDGHGLISQTSAACKVKTEHQRFNMLAAATAGWNCTRANLLIQNSATQKGDLHYGSFWVFSANLARMLDAKHLECSSIRSGTT